MLEVVEESVNMMEDKDPNGYDLNMSSPMHGNKLVLVLKGAHSKESSQGPLVIRGPNSIQPSKTNQVKSKNITSKLVVNLKSNYSLVD